jgi:hypothetical protein
MADDIYTADERRLIEAWFGIAFRSVPAPTDTRQVPPCSSHAFPTRDGPPEPHRAERVTRGHSRSIDSSAAEVRL